MNRKCVTINYNGTIRAPLKVGEDRLSTLLVS